MKIGVSIDFDSIKKKMEDAIDTFCHGNGFPVEKVEVTPSVDHDAVNIKAIGKGTAYYRFFQEAFMEFEPREGIYAGATESTYHPGKYVVFVEMLRVPLSSFEIEGEFAK